MNKQIEKMAKIIDQAQKQGYQRIFEETRKFVQENHRYSSKNDYGKAHSQTIDEIIAEALYNAACRLVDDIVEKVTVERPVMCDLLNEEQRELQKVLETRKETAKEILQEQYTKAKTNGYGGVLLGEIKDFAEKYGVEVE